MVPVSIAVIGSKNNDGIFIFEQPDFAIGAISLKFDQIYHEHVSYLTTKNITGVYYENIYRNYITRFRKS